MFHTAFIGTVLFQLAFVIYQYVLLRRKEFISYFFYSVIISVFILATAFPQNNPLTFTVTADNPFTIGRGLLMVGYGVYYHFGRYFTESPKLYPHFDRHLKIVSYCMIGQGIIDILLILAGVPYFILDKIVHVMMLLQGAYSLYVIGYLFTRHTRLTQILVVGSLLLLAGGLAGLFVQLAAEPGSIPFSASLNWLEAGVTGEFLCLNFGLIYKTKIIEQDYIRQLNEQYQKLAQERSRITADLHDDIGATLSSMSIYGELAGAIWEQQPDESRKMVDKIADTSKELLGRMGDIIWSMKPSDEEKYSLNSRLKNYTADLLAPKGIVCDIDMDERLSVAIIQPEKRKNILLIAKEAINNIAKYSGATTVRIVLQQHHESVILSISDNGAGFDTASISYGNGLKNMQYRCQQLKGTCQVISSAGRGTTVACIFPIAIFSHA